MEFGKPQEIRDTGLDQSEGRLRKRRKNLGKVNISTRGPENNYKLFENLEKFQETPGNMSQHGKFKFFKFPNLNLKFRAENI